MEKIKEIPKKCFWWLLKAGIAGLVAVGKVMEHLEVK